MRNKTPKIVNEFDKITGSVLPYFASDQGLFYFKFIFIGLVLYFFVYLFVAEDPLHKAGGCCIPFSPLTNTVFSGALS